MHRFRILFALLALAAVATLSGCFNPFDPRVSSERSASTPAPVPSTPQGVIKLFVWCWQNRDPSLYSEIFTDDYRFIFATADSAGNEYRDSPWIREYEMSMAAHMFEGGTDHPPASDIQITVDNPLLANDDTRPGRNPLYHRAISTNVSLKITFDNNGTPDVQTVSGRALFYVVRGDSAAIPQELVDKGFRPDPTRWWIERWEDQTAGGTSLTQGLVDLARARRAAVHTIQPGQQTFGKIKADWL